MSLEIIITDAGRAEIINAENTGTAPVVISEIGFGTGQYTASAAQTSLTNEFKRLSTFSGDSVGDEVIHVSCRDEGEDAYQVYEIGLYFESGTLFAVYSQNTSIIDKSASSVALLSADIALTSVNTASVTFGNTDFMNPPATTTTKGVVELATSEETQAGSDSARAVTPAGLDSRTATSSRSGMVELATETETQAGSDSTRAVTPRGLESRVQTGPLDDAENKLLKIGAFGLGDRSQPLPGNNLNITDGSVKTGLYRVSTETVGAPVASNGNVLWMTRTSGGGESQLFFCESNIRLFFRTRVSDDWPEFREIAHTENIESLINEYVLYASETQKGIVELATSAETQAGTDSSRAVTPAGLESKTAAIDKLGLVELATETETQAGTNSTKAVTPRGLESRVQTTRLDDDVDKLLKTGAFGLGERTQLLPGDNLNLTDGSVKTGLYRVRPATIGVPIASSGNVLWMTRTSGGGESQLFFCESNIRLFFRTRVSDDWPEFREIAHTENIENLISDYIDTRINTTGNLGTAANQDIGTGANQVPDKEILDARLGTTGNLGTAANQDIGAGANQVPDKEILDARLGTTGNLGTAANQDIGTGANQVPDKEILDARLGTTGNLGTAANLDVTTSSTDTAENRVSKVGDVAYPKNQHGKEFADFNNVNDSPNAWNSEQNVHYKATSNNNAIAVLLGGTFNNRVAAIQVGHAQTNFAGNVGILHLNPFGGEVYKNGYPVLNIENIGSNTEQVPDNAQLNVRFGGYTGNLGTAARFNKGSGNLDIPDNAELNGRLGTTDNLGDVAQRSIGTGANQVPDKEILDSRLGTTGDISARYGEGNNIMVGAVVYFATTVTPSGYIKANGAAVSRTTYANLFARVGTFWGTGNGSTTFNVPDLRGEFIRSFDDGRGVDSGRSFGSFQADEFKSHNHTLPVRDNNNTGNNYIEDADSTQLVRTASTGFTGGDETRPRNIALIAYIKY